MPYRSLLLALLILALAGCAPGTPAALSATPTPASLPTLPEAVATMEPVLPPTPAPTEPPGNAPPPTPAPTDTPAGPRVLEGPGPLEGPTQTLFNRTTALSVDLPANWIINDISQQVEVTRMYTITMHSPLQPRGPKQQEGLLPGEAKIDMLVDPTEQPMSYNEAVVYWRASITGGEFPAKILDEKMGQLPSGLPATRWMVQSDRGETVVWTLVEVEDSIVIFVGMGELTVTDQITATARIGD